MDLLTLAIGGGAGAGLASLLTKWREHKVKGSRGLSDELPYFIFIDDTTILNKDGSFMRAWRYRGPDMATATNNELNTIAEQVNAALKPYDDGWMFHVDAIRRPSTSYDTGTGFRSASAKLLDEERRQAYVGKGANFETQCVLVVTYLPPSGLSSKMGKGLVKGGAVKEVDTFASDLAQAQAEFEREVESLEDRIGSIVKLSPMKGPQFLEHLHGCLTGYNHPVAVPYEGAYLSALLASETLVAGLSPRVGKNHVATVSTTGFPNHTQMGMLDGLGELGVSYRWSTRFIPLSEAEADKWLRKYRKLWVGKRDGVKKLLMAGNAKEQAPDPDAELFQDGNAAALGKDAADGLSLSSSREVRFGFYTSVVVLMGEDRKQLDKASRKVLKALRTVGLTARVDDYNATQAFLGTLPGLGKPNIKRPLLHTRNLAHLLPLTTPWPGESTNPCGLFPEASPPLIYAKTTGTTPFRLNIHDDDVGHTLIVGSTGAGKSVLVGEIALQFLRYEGAQTFVFDVGYAHYLGCLACGGQHYDLMAPDGAGLPGGSDGKEGRPAGPTFQPLAGIDDLAERAWALEWLLDVVDSQDVKISPQQREALDTALNLVAQSPVHDRTLYALYYTLQDSELRQAIQPYTSEQGVYGQMFDGKEDSIAMGQQQVIEMKHVLDMSKAVVIPALTYLFHRLEQRLDGSPTLIVIEEAWSALMQGRFSDKLREWLLTLRKRNASVILVGHSPAQFQEGAKVQMLASSCHTKIFLPNPEARETRNAALYRTLGLNDKEILILSNATKKRDYLLKNTKGSRLFQLGWGPVAASLLASRPGLSMEQTLAEAQKLEARLGDRWFAEWMRGANEPGKAEEWEAIYEDMHRQVASGFQDRLVAGQSVGGGDGAMRIPDEHPVSAL